MSRSWLKVLHGSVSLGLLLYAIYVYRYKKILISGKLTGHAYQLDNPASIIVACSSLLAAIFIILVLFENPVIKKLNPIILLLTIILFVVGVYI